VLLYWEIVDKKDASGKLLHEMILVCNALKNNLDHPNEYIRGSTLRFLCRIIESEILESLIPSVTANLQHRHSYVRKNAVLAVWAVFSNFPELMPDAPELLHTFVMQESNPAAKRNAFQMLVQVRFNHARFCCVNPLLALPLLPNTYQTLTALLNSSFLFLPGRCGARYRIHGRLARHVAAAVRGASARGARAGAQSVSCQPDAEEPIRQMHLRAGERAIQDGAGKVSE
jgi:hypothetical protein